MVVLHLPTISYGETKPVAISLKAQRNYGYALGDEIKLTALVKTRYGYQYTPGYIQPNSQINGWLILKSIKLQKAAGDYNLQLILSYQIFKYVKATTYLTIPALPLRFQNSRKTFAAKVPAWNFSYHPTIPAQLPDAKIKIEPPYTPKLIDANKDYRILLFLGSVIAILLFFLAWIYDKLPFLRNYSGCFGPACRLLKQLDTHTETELNQRLALHTFHQAINQLAGTTVFAEHLEDFFTANPGYRPAKESTEHFFQYSQDFFFVAEKMPSQPLTTAQIYQLCLQYRKIERASRWT